MAYTLTGRKCGTIRFEQDSLIGSESESRSSTVTSNPIEDGSTIEDHHVNGNSQFSLGGVTVGGMAAYNSLKEMQDKHDLLTYAGKFRMSDLVITSLSRNASKDNKDGCGFSVSLQAVHIGTSEYMEMGATPMMSAQDKNAKKAEPKATTEKTASKGTTTQKTDTLTSDAYYEYVDSFNGNIATANKSSANPATSGLR
jgi:hypothetical protein